MATMRKARPTSFRPMLHAVQVLQERNSQSTLNGLGIYLTITLGLLVASLILHNSLRFAERSLVYIALQPLFLPIMICLGLVALYLAITASVAVARERDRRTLEVLLYGPVDQTSFLLGIFAAQLKVYLVAALITLVWANLVTWLLHLAFSWALIGLLLTSVVMAGALIAFGMLTAVWGDRTRTALVYFFLVVLLLAGIQIGDQVVSNMAATMGEGSSESLLLIRSVLARLSQASQWVSPLSQFAQTVEALANRQMGVYFSRLAVLLAQAGLLLLASVKILQWKGGRG